MSNINNEQIQYGDNVEELSFDTELAPEQLDQTINLSEDDVARYVKSFFYKNSPDKIKISIAKKALSARFLNILVDHRATTHLEEFFIIRNNSLRFSSTN